MTTRLLPLLFLALLTLGGAAEKKKSAIGMADAPQKLLELKAKFPPMRTGKTLRKIEFQIPHVDVWSYYQGMIRTATLEGLPITLRQLDARRGQDAQTWAGIATSTGGVRGQGSESEQASATANWLNRELKRYLDEVRAFVGRR